MTKKPLGILLTNTGTPDSPTPDAIKKYLREFLSDPRIIQLPRSLWLPILYGFILPLRPKRIATLYQSVWQANDSPMRIFMRNIQKHLQERFNQSEKKVLVEMGMNYGSPSIVEALKKLHDQKVEKIIFLPLFPQFSYTTTASSIDRLMKGLSQLDLPPKVSLIHHYANHPLYIQMLSEQILNARKEKKPDKLLISFHGMPLKYITKGDPYESACRLTAETLAEALKLNADEWILCYQSQFGYAKWLGPSTQTLFTDLPKQGVKHLDVICPGFAVDCLETLEEISIRGKNIFMQAGGVDLRYLPALNDSPSHLDLLIDIINLA